MATVLWGNVYATVNAKGSYEDVYAGRLQEEPSGRCVFTYDSSYIEAGYPAIAHTLPVRKEPYISEQGLHPFFDNLVAEGWFKNAQARALGIHPDHRFALLLGFGLDLAGSVSIVDPKPREHRVFDHADEATLAALSGRASLSGVQRKLLVVKDGAHYRPTRAAETSTHIAKLASGNLQHLIEIEYLTTLAIQKLLPQDEMVSMEVGEVNFTSSKREKALIVKRFDRNARGKKILHFEEFNQLLGKRAGDDKYNGSYEDMAGFIHNTTNCILTDVDRLFRRILVCLLVGNTDAHFKNFAMFHTREGLRLTPAYDLVASAIYPDFQSIALAMAGKGNACVVDMRLTKLEEKHLFFLGQQFKLPEKAINRAIADINSHFSDAIKVIERSEVGTLKLKNELKTIMEKQWNRSFKLAENFLSKKLATVAKSKS